MKTGTVLWALAAFAVTAFGQDPPSRVARLSYLSGAVSFQPGTVDDWSAATLNYPLSTGDHLYADQGASAEAAIGPNFIRIAHQTNFGFLNLDDRTVQIRLTEGSVDIRISALDEQEIWEVDTPNGAISLLRAGDYRIDTDPTRNATMVTVRGGEAEMTASGQIFPVHAQQTGYFSGDGQQQSVREANPPDEFDRFSEDRDREVSSAPPPQYVSENMVGYQDLARNGTWEPESEYGPIWRPRVAAGWAPYHDGRWVWREPWGWTWVDDAPWGFAPFHYGRWAYIRGGWAWAPGPTVVRRPVYAPALVAFVGGPNIAVSINVGGGGGVGWFPLGPREVYTPVYRVSPAYVRRVNVTEVNVTNVYINRNAPGAVTVISRNDFVTAHQVQRSARIDPQQFRSAPVTGFTPGIAPQRESLFGRTAGNVARPHDTFANRQVFVRNPPPQAAVSFAARQQALQENGGRPLAPEQLRDLRGRDGNVRSEPQFRQSGAPRRDVGREVAPQQTPATPDVRPRPDNRFQGRPPGATPRTDTPVENRGFGRNSQPQPRTDTVPQPRTPDLRPNQPPVTPRAPETQSPAQNRNVDRQQSQREERREQMARPEHSNNKPKEEKPKDDKPKDDKPKDDKKEKPKE